MSIVALSAEPQLTITAECYWMLGGIVSYSLYFVLLKRNVETEERLDIPMFLGFVGLFCFVLLWPGVYVLHAFKLEVFYPLPTRAQLAWLAMNGLVGTVLAEYLLLLWAVGVRKLIFAGAASSRPI